MIVKSYKVSILEVPSIEELSNGNLKIDSLRIINLDDLLAKLSIPQLSAQEIYRGRSILITGAGGSIGTEICLQILKIFSQIILLEHDEYALYKITQKYFLLRSRIIKCVTNIGFSM